jgi:hypothetical protein
MKESVAGSEEYKIADFFSANISRIFNVYFLRVSSLANVVHPSFFVFAIATSTLVRARLYFLY